MKLEQLEEGQRFRTNYTQRIGTVLHISDSGATVKWEKDGKKVRIVKKAKWKDQQEKVCEFDAPGKPVLISGGTEVTPLSEEESHAA